MEGPSKPPLLVAICRAVVRVVSLLVPAAQRAEWQREWLAEIWHRWQFLLHTGAWNSREQMLLCRDCAGSIVDAAWIFTSQEHVGARAREYIRSPFACLAVPAIALLFIAACSSGLPATRELLRQFDGSTGRLLFVWIRPVLGGADKGLPSDVVPAWASHSRYIEKVAGFRANEQTVVTERGNQARLLVVTTQPDLFGLFEAAPMQGAIPHQGGVVLDYRASKSLFHGQANILGSIITIGENAYPVSAVIRPNFQFLSRQASIYLVQPTPVTASSFVIARVKPGVTKQTLSRELTKIAEDVCYYFLQGQLRLSFAENALLTPLWSFGAAVLASGALVFMVSRVRVRHFLTALQRQNRKAAARRASFFMAKAALGLSCVFAAGLEASRSDSAVLFASQDPGSGPFLVWLYVLGTMGLLFWALADQRARCRVCLRLLAFPVRIGCPGCLLLEWSGTELCCSEGHGVLHVPHLAPSWDEEAERWISLDESWSGLFSHK